MNGVSDQAGGAADKAKGLAGDTAGQAQDLPNKAKDLAGELPAEPESVFSEDATKSATDKLDQGKDAAGGALGKAKDTAGGVSGKAQDAAGGVTDKAKGGLGQVQDTTGDLSKQGQNAASGLTDKAGDVKDKAGQTVNGAQDKVGGEGKNLDAYTVESPGGDISEALGGLTKGQDVGALIKGFTPETGGSGTVDAGGIQISVQTTKDGMSLTINIPGSFQQQK